MSGTLPGAYWGDADAPLADWRKADTDDDPDDELLDETPEDVVGMLGFDPLDETEDDARQDDAGFTTALPGALVADVMPPEGETGGLIRGAGLLLIHHGKQGDRILFVRHRDRGTWEFPGGTIEPGETAEDAAMREVREEIGASAHGRATLLMRDRMTGVDYSTFMATVNDCWTPRLADGELTDFQWASPDYPPEPLHPGARLALARLGMNELDIARAIADGRMTSPQSYENIWLFALRITGTGVSYRPELDEIVWRDPARYLNGDFLDRCNGLQVIWEHPPGDALDQSEFEKRTLGAIVLPYLMQDEVWGIAKIYDVDAAEMMLDTQLSTSPAVVFRDPSVNEYRELGDGTHLLIEGEPSLLDHLAVCELGVWDKGGEPTGISRSEPPERADARRDAQLRDIEIELRRIDLSLDDTL